MRMMRCALILAVLAVLAWTAPGIIDAGDMQYPPEMVHPTVMAPIPDGVSLAVPSILGNRDLAKLGYVDVTASPFRADPTGRSDSTRAIQRAVNFARDHQMVCFFPQGEYRVSDTIRCVQQYYQRTNNAVLGAREHPCVLIGEAVSRPTIVLAPYAPGFGDPSRPKRVIEFVALALSDPDKHQGDISMNQMLLNLDVVVGQGNDGAVGVFFEAAQGSGIQDCAVDVTNGLVGIEGGAGAGGSFANITVTGGDIGLDLRWTQPSCTIVGATLTGQRGRAILYAGRETLTAVGVRIVTKTQGPVIESRSVRWNPHQGQICLVDASIDFRRAQGTAIQAGSSLYLRDVYVRNASALVAGRPVRLPGEAKSWRHASEYALRLDPRPWKGFAYTAPILVDGRDAGAELLQAKTPGPPPADLAERHLWAPDFPLFRSSWALGDPSVINVKEAPHLASGDGKSDDTEALQAALDDAAASGRTVFLPKGYYLISRPLELPPGTRLVGTAQNLSVIMTRPSLWRGGTTTAPLPLLRTSKAASPPTMLSQFRLFAPREVPQAYALHWRAAGDSILRNVAAGTHPPLDGYARPGQPPDRAAPLVLADGGGRWYDFFQEDYKPHAPSYRHLLIRRNSGPLSIYQCDVEHARGEANMEISQGSDVTVYGLKGEGNLPIARITDSRRVAILGYGGNATAREGGALFEVRNCEDCRLANLVNHPRLPGVGSDEFYAGRGTDPARWIMVRSPDAGDTKPFQRPVLYMTGSAAAP